MTSCTKVEASKKTEASALVEKPQEDHGEPTKYDPTFNGPIKNRGCTDCICCLLFLICFLGMIAVAVLGFARGDPVKLLYPTDSDGNMCGSGNFVNQPNLFFFDLLDCAKMGAAVLVSGCPTPQICVAKCPNTTFSWLKSKIPGINENDVRKEMYCTQGTNAPTSPKTIQALVEDEDCAAYYVKSEPIVGRCIPSIFTKLLNKTANLVSNTSGDEIRDKLNQTVTGTSLEQGTKYLALFLSAKEYGVKIYQDVRAAWWMILIGLAISMIISFIWIVIMRWIAAPMVWLSLICFIVLFGFATYYCISKYIQMKDNPENQIQGAVEFTTNLSYYWNLAGTWLVFGIIAGVILLIVIILLIFLRQRILIAIALIKESSRAVACMIFTLFFPLFPFILEVILFGFWGASAIYLASSGTASYSAFNKTYTNVTENSTTNGITTSITKLQENINELASNIDCAALTSNNSAVTKLQSFCNFVKYGGDEYTIYLQFFQLFMLFWCMNFIVAFGQMVLAGAFASYYWAFRKPADIPMFPLASSIGRTMRYHLGTIAFGSLIIAIIQMIRVCLEYLDHKLKGSENPVAKFFLKCLKCCFWCLEKFMKFLNKNAYIMCAVYGKNFCISAKNAFFLIIRNIVRVAVVDKVTDFLLFIGKLFVVGAVGVFSMLFFNGDIVNYIPKQAVNDYVKNYVPPLNNYLVPVTIICIGSYIIAAAFFSVYGMAVDTLFLCFLEDLERHDGSDEKPYYMSKELMGILGKKNKREK